MGTKEHAGDTTTIQVAPDLPKPIMAFDRPAKWHANRPAELRCPDIVPDDFAVFG